ncbi:hypothetical protein SAMN05421747_13214 [Parapedobacter composti]|uniref:Chaperone of endosialidase n=1 Tax=Parapedobacter composti TaxID=623281 RepID=A0A1I1MD75_9SPHI|nr:hypothetical protein [Parapedobacter composti]SFC82802.1 hypothetical protein SAMN05421747_13214 [Parapedobacter composti]
MKFIFTCCFLMLGYALKAQYYPSIASYFFNGTTSQGVKIKTNIPFSHGLGMPLVMIKGYNYNTGEVIAIDIVWYVYNGAFTRHSATAYGSAAPEIRLSNENGKIIIHLSNNVYYQRFYVSAFAQGKSENSTHFTGWTVASEPVNGTSTVLVSYKQHLAGTLNMPGNSIWTSTGNVGIGTANPQAKLAVNGNILAKEVKVKTDISVPDYVFESDYELPSLAEIEAYVKQHKHLPEIPSAADIQRDGLDLAAMNLLLLKKVEELTLHLIEKENKIQAIHEELIQLKSELTNRK